MGVFLTFDVIATVAGGILSGKNTFPRDGVSGRASGKACWNGRKKRRFESPFRLLLPDTGKWQEHISE